MAESQTVFQTKEPTARSETISNATAKEYGDFASNVNEENISEIDPTAEFADESFIARIDKCIAQGNHMKVKRILRKNYLSVFAPLRGKLWLKLCRQHATNSNMPEGFYWELVKHASGSIEDLDEAVPLPAFITEQQCLPYHLTAKGCNSANRIINILIYENPVINFCLELHPIVSLLLHYMPEEDVYYSVSTLLNSTERVFVNQTKMLYDVTGQTVYQMAKKHAKSAILYLEGLCPNLNLENAFKQWNWWILAGLPFVYLVRIMDCYLHEGIKVLYRVTFVLLNLFVKHWHMVLGLSKVVIRNNFTEAMTTFCKRIPVLPANLMAHCFAIRGFSSAYIARQYIIADKLVKERNEMTGAGFSSQPSKINILTMTHSLALSDQLHTQTWQKILFTLWTWMPTHVSMLQPLSLYSTISQARSLKTVYELMMKHQPTLMVIETNTDEIFGIYCGYCWSKPKSDTDKGILPIYEATADSFVFTLYPKRCKYPWVVVLDDSSDASFLSERRAMEKQLVERHTGANSEAIWLDDRLMTGRTSLCKSYSSPPLCPRESFEVRMLQIFGFVDMKYRPQAHLQSNTSTSSFGAKYI